MLIYGYHPETGELTGVSEAEESPFGDGEFLIPAHSTQIVPPESVSVGYALAFDGQAWGEVLDHRGETWFTAEGEPMTINLIGNPVDHGLQAEAPPLPEPEPEPEGLKMRFALVSNGVVLQTLEAELPMRFDLADGCEMIVDGNGVARPGFTYDGSKFEPPAPAEPVE